MKIIEKIKNGFEHIVFGLIISGIFGIIAFMLLVMPIFFNAELLESVVRLIAFSLFEIGLFISGVIFSIKDDKEQKTGINNNESKI